MISPLGSDTLALPQFTLQSSCVRVSIPACSQALPLHQKPHFSRVVTPRGHKSCRSPPAVNWNLVKALRDLLEDTPRLGFSIPQEPTDPQNKGLMCKCVWFMSKYIRITYTITKLGKNVPPQFLYPKSIMLRDKWVDSTSTKSGSWWFMDTFICSLIHSASIYCGVCRIPSFCWDSWEKN